MLILILNCGGTSIKYQVIDITERKELVILRGALESIGAIRSTIRQTRYDDKYVESEIEAQDYYSGLQAVFQALISPICGIGNDYNSIDAVGHRVVQAGEIYRGTYLVNPDLLDALRQNIELAPLHNPANIAGSEFCQRLMPGIPQVAVFDNAWHKDIPDYAYIYALPYEYYQKYGIRRYGFHGISFKYMTERAAALLDLDLSQQRVVSLMLGSGTTISATAYGCPVDVSTGLTPTEGLIQSTRSGDVDPGVVTYIMRKEGLTPDQMDQILNRKSGWLGISGVSNNLKLVEQEAERGNHRANLALDAFSYRCKKYIGAYAAAMGGLDLLIFSGGVGENSSMVRAKVCTGLQFLGIELDPELNTSLLGEGSISRAGSSVPVIVIDTNEEMLIAREVHAFLGSVGVEVLAEIPR